MKHSKCIRTENSGKWVNFRSRNADHTISIKLDENHNNEFAFYFEGLLFEQLIGGSQLYCRREVNNLISFVCGHMCTGWFGSSFLSDFITQSASFGCRASYFPHTVHTIWYERRCMTSTKVVLVWWRRACSRMIGHIFHRLVFAKSVTQKSNTKNWSNWWKGLCLNLGKHFSTRHLYRTVGTEWHVPN